MTLTERKCLGWSPICSQHFCSRLYWLFAQWGGLCAISIASCAIGFALNLRKRTSHGSKNCSVLSQTWYWRLYSGAVAMPVIWRWFGWLACWIGFVVLVLSIGQVNRLPWRTRLVLGVMLVAIFVIFLAPISYSQWREERAAALEGDLIFPSQSANGVPVYIGEGGAPIPPLSGEGEIFADSKLTLENQRGRILVSTTVRDEQGEVVVTIDRNHWLMTQFCLDK